MSLTLRAREEVTIIKFICIAKCQYMSYCLREMWAVVDILVW